MFQFLQPYILFLLIPIVGLVVFLYILKKKSLHFGGLKDISTIYKSGSFSYKIYYILIFIILSITVIITAQPVIKNTHEKIKKNGIDIMLLLDISTSMNAQDLQPSRLEVTKNIIINFLESRKNDRIGLIVFAGKPFSALPLNFDYNVSKKIIQNITTETINQIQEGLGGTAIGDGLILAGDYLQESDRTKVIILLTDGTPDGDKLINPEVAIQFMNQKYTGKEKIKIYTIGIGGDKEIYVQSKNSLGFTKKILVEGVDENILKKIAKLGGGKYFRADNKEILQDIFQNISELEKTEIEINSFSEIRSISKYFIYLLTIFFGIFIYYKTKKNII